MLRSDGGLIRVKRGAGDYTQITSLSSARIIMLVGRSPLLRGTRGLSRLPQATGTNFPWRIQWFVAR